MEVKTKPFDPADYIQSEDDIVEYLKIHQDPPTPEGYQPPVCHLWGQAL